MSLSDEVLGSWTGGGGSRQARAQQGSGVVTSTHHGVGPRTHATQHNTPCHGSPPAFPHTVDAELHDDEQPAVRGIFVNPVHRHDVVVLVGAQRLKAVGVKAG